MAGISVDAKANLKVAKKLFKKVDFNLLSKAVIAQNTSSSSKHGGDCLEIAMIVAGFLQRLGIDAKVEIGEAVWRVEGNHDGAVISHIVTPDVVTLLDSEFDESIARPYHAWVKLNAHWYLDSTTYQIKMKMARLDKADGLNTPVTWCPDFLLFNQGQVSTYDDVAKSYKSGVIYYNTDCACKSEILSTIQKDNLDFGPDINSLVAIYNGIKSGELDVVCGQFGGVQVS